jgi:hypothetical protein
VYVLSEAGQCGAVARHAVVVATELVAHESAEGEEIPR